VILLKNYAPQHLILMPAFRSPDTTRLCLFNNSLLLGTGSDGGGQSAGGGGDAQQLGSFAAFKTANIMPRVLDEIVWPMRQLEVCFLNKKNTFRHIFGKSSNTILWKNQI
jgi:hypothetical protein